MPVKIIHHYQSLSDVSSVTCTKELLEVSYQSIMKENDADVTGGPEEMDQFVFSIFLHSDSTVSPSFFTKRCVMKFSRKM